MNKTDCAGYDECVKYSDEKDLRCEDCCHYIPTEIDDAGRTPFYVRASAWKEVDGNGD